MQKIIERCFVVSVALAAITLVVGACAAEASSAVQDSVTTVDELLKADNAAARTSVQKTSGVAVVPSSVSRSIPHAGVAVHKITAVGDSYKVTLTYNGVDFQDIGVGATVAGCRLVRVEAQCVVFETLPKAKKSDATSSQCSTACWTGHEPLAATATPPQSAGGPLPFGGPQQRPVVPSLATSPQNVGVSRQTTQ